jgi:hypothetical protein
MSEAGKLLLLIPLPVFGNTLYQTESRLYSLIKDMETAALDNRVRKRKIYEA